MREFQYELPLKLEDNKQRVISFKEEKDMHNEALRINKKFQIQ